MHKITGGLAAAVLLTTIMSSGATAAEPTVSPDRADQVIVRYKVGTTPAERGAIAREHRLKVIDTSANGRMQVVIAEGRSRATARRLLAGDHHVEAVANNSWRELTHDPADESYFAEMWGIHNTGQEVLGISGTADVDIDGLQALRLTRGSPDVVVAVIDDGIDMGHVELADHMWFNDAEANGGAGIDDDGNGYIDDINGWDFCNDRGIVVPYDPDGYNGPIAPDGHGTHVAGTIAGGINGGGTIGVAAGVRVMTLQAFQEGSACGSGDLALAEAIDYAAWFGVPIINASWGGRDPSAVLDVAIGASNSLFVTAAGNNGWDIDVDGQQFYPAASTLPNILTVTAIDQRGRLPDFANYGKKSVDIAAPGVNILSSWPTQEGVCNPCYVWSSGTSMAVPHVAGIAALALSATAADLTTAQLKARVLGSGVSLASNAGKTVTGDLVNALRAIDTVGPVATPINRHGINVGTIVGSTVSTTMTWPAATDALSGVKSYMIRRSLDGAAWTTLISSTTTRSYKRTMSFGTPTRFQLYARDYADNLGKGATGPNVTATLLQDGTSIAKYTGTWSNVNLSSASGGRLHRSTRKDATVTFTTSARAIAVVGRRGPLNGKAKVYVDGVYKSTIDLYRSTYKSRVVVFNTSWNTTATHSVKLVVLGTSGRPRIDIDAFVFLR